LGSATTLGILLYGTPSYVQPQSILNGRVFQLGANVRFCETVGELGSW
jgi:hypothetical protein